MKEHQYFVYILECSDGLFYVGVTNNLDKRFDEHLQGIDSTCFTFKRRPVILKYFEIFIDIKQAISREKQLKGWSRKKKIALMTEDFNALVQLSKNYSDRVSFDNPSKILRQAQGDKQLDIQGDNLQNS